MAILFVRGTRTCLLSAASTRGAGQLTQEASRTVRTSYAYQPRSCHTHPVLWRATQVEDINPVAMEVDLARTEAYPVCS